MIEFRDVGKRFADGTVGLESLSLTAREGEITVLVGPSGCGKTTSLRTVNRMVEPTSGSVLLAGKDVAEGDPALLRRGIGYVIQQAGLFPHRRVLDNVATVPVLQGLPRKEARARAAEVLERVGLDATMAQRWPAQLSGGQQQRVGVARALAGDAPVLLMDEPFSAVDPVVRVELQDELLRLQADLGKTILFVTHDIDEAIRLGDRVAVLRVGGRLAQFAPPDELLAHPADEFVSGFVGRDRGYRRLGFVPATALQLRELPTRADANGDSGVPGEWTVLLDGAERPAAWLGPDGVRHELGSVYVTEGGAEGVTAASEAAGTLRGALDAALSSPARPGRGGRPRGPVPGRGRPRRRAGAAAAGPGPVRAFGYDIDELVIAHVLLALIPVLVGLVIALPLGWWAHRSRGARRVLVPLSGALYTIPSLALIVFIPILVGTPILSPLNVGLTLVIYTVALLVRSVAEALDAVPVTVATAAVAVGYRPSGLFFGVQLPLAVPVLTAGIRVASVSAFSLVTVGALVGVQSLGTLMTDGFQQSYPAMVAAGIIGSIVLAFVFDALWLALGRALTPWVRARTGV